MFTNPTLVALALSLTVSASPIVDGLGTRVPLEQRRSLTKDDGWFDHPQAIYQVVRDHNKHRQNLINLKKNMGSEYMNKGARILPVANSTALLDSKAAAVEKRQAEPLKDYSETFWGGNVAIGSNKKNFLIDFDTGSSDLWIPFVNCTTKECSNKNKYNPASSSTSAHKSGAFSIAYGDGSNVTGLVYTDTVTVAGVTAHNQYFSPVNTLSSTFATEAEDGILGLAFPAISNLHQSPFFNTAKSQGAIKAGVFAIKLASSGSELYLGGTNSKLYSGAIESHKIVGPGYWQIADMTLMSGSEAVESNQQTIIDSGTTLIYGPPSLVAALYKTIPGSKPYNSQPGFYEFPCTTTPSNIGFNWGGKTWTISAENFRLGQVSLTMCVGAVVAQDMGLGDNVWLLGDSFMKNAYSVFSFDQKTVGFAQLN